MGLLSEIEKIKNADVLITIFAFIFLIVPGAMVMFLFVEDIFLQIDIFKLILISLAIMSPFVFFNLFVVDELFVRKRVEKDSSKDDEIFLCFMFSSIFTGSVFLGLIFGVYSSGGQLVHLVLTTFVLEFVVCIFCAVMAWKRQNKNTKPPG